MILRNFFTCLFVSFLFISNAQTISWSEVAPGVWKGIVGQPEQYNLLTASGASPMVSGLNSMEKTSFPLVKSEISATLSDGKTGLRFPLQKDEQLYGFEVLKKANLIALVK